jgi:hypothetical protein
LFDCRKSPGARSLRRFLPAQLAACGSPSPAAKGVAFAAPRPRLSSPIAESLPAALSARGQKGVTFVR